MEYVELMAALTMTTNSVLVNTPNRKSQLIFKVMPLVMGFLIMIDALSRLGWI